MTENSISRYEVLLVEDGDGDAEVARDALDRGGVHNRVHHVRDLAEALAWLHRGNAQSPARRPDLVLLDLELPGDEGERLLAAIKQDPALCDIPVVVLGRSDTPEAVVRRFRRQANCVISRPRGFHEFVALIGDLLHFWFEVARLPRHHGA